MPGVERVDGGRYQRAFSVGSELGWLSVSPVRGLDQVELQVRGQRPAALAVIVARVRRLLDLDADPLAIEQDLARDPMLRPHVRACPGLRVLGTWDGFELGVRLVLSQGAATRTTRVLCGRLSRCLGSRLEDGTGRVWFTFPTPDVLVEADLASLGVPAPRATTLRRFARGVHEHTLDLDTPRDVAGLVADLQGMSGMHAETARYLALRVQGPSDAFLASDTELLRGATLCLGGSVTPSITPTELERRAERWRPWRAYAVAHLRAAAARHPRPFVGRHLRRRRGPSRVDRPALALSTRR